MPDEIHEVTEPVQGPVKPQQQNQPKQQGQKQQNGQQNQKQKRSSAPIDDDELREIIDGMRKSWIEIQASLSVQDDMIRVLSTDIHEAAESAGLRQKDVMAAIRAADERSAKALETVQQMHRALMARLNEREKPRTWTSGYVAIAVFSAAMLLCLVLVWR